MKTETGEPYLYVDYKAIVQSWNGVLPDEDAALLAADFRRYLWGKHPFIAAHVDQYRHMRKIHGMDHNHAVRAVVASVSDRQAVKFALFYMAFRGEEADVRMEALCEYGRSLMAKHDGYGTEVNMEKMFILPIAPDLIDCVLHDGWFPPSGPGRAVAFGRMAPHRDVTENDIRDAKRLASLQLVADAVAFVRPEGETDED